MDFFKQTIDEQVSAINEALKDEVYPVLHGDGGGLEIMDIKDDTILIRYYGACSGCPMATTGTLEFIENTIQNKVDTRLKVQIV
jgi:Fe-S cluster biogenesis protein NfuA